MIVSAISREVVNQLLRVAPFQPNDRIFVCCSGSFRVDLAVKTAIPGAMVSGNDVALIPCAVGALLTGHELDFAFARELSWIEHALHGKNYAERLAALMVALEASQYNRQTDYGAKHYDHYVGAFEKHLDIAHEKLINKFQDSSIDEFWIGDFRAQALRAAEADGIVLGFPPATRSGPDATGPFKKLAESIDWAKPKQGPWEPNAIAEWFEEMRKLGTRFCVYWETEIEGERPATKYLNPRGQAVCLYTHGSSKSSVRLRQPKSTPFRYTPVDPAALTRETTVSVAKMEAAQFNFLRNKYLAKGIQFCDGMYQYGVLLDGKIAGGFAYNRDSEGSRDTLYLLSDFSIRRETRLAKLIAMIATSRVCVRDAERKMLLRFDHVFTTVFTHRAVSMKYRGIYRLYDRKPGFLQYEGDITEETPEQIYQRWFARYVENEGQDSQPVRAKHARR